MHIILHSKPASSLHLAVTPGQTLAQAIWLSGLVTPPPLCSALGRCGRCRVRFCGSAPAPLPAEETLLTPEELAQGWRLACRHTVDALPDEVELELPAGGLGTPAAQAAREPEISGGAALAQPLPGVSGVPGAPASAAAAAPSSSSSSSSSAAADAPRALLLAVDLGTTSLHWRAVTPEGHMVAQGQEINPQMGAGSEVMSRLAAARRPGGLERLSGLAQAALRRIVEALPAPVSAICVAANTAMTAILLQKDISGLSAAPYRVPLAGNGTEHLPDLPPLYIPPQPAPFVGGDISAGLAALLHMHAPQWPFLLADLGTNGEFVLGITPEQCYLASVPLGPALEGIGLTFGDMAGPGAVTGFSLTPAGLAAVTWDGGAPVRICGTGYLSLVHTLLRAGLLRADGTFALPCGGEGAPGGADASPSCPPLSPLARRLAAQLYRVHGETRLPLPGGLYLAAGDVEEILKVKAAFSLALEGLLAAAGLAPARLRAIYLSGALGSHVPAGDLEALGFVPHGSGPRLRALGNTSLDGAQWLLLHPQCRDALALWSRKCRVLDLTAHPGFTQHYLRHMRFA